MSLMDQQNMQAPQSGGDYATPPVPPPTPYPSMTPNMSKGGTVPRRVQKFATGGYASSPISGSATGMPAASPIGGYTPGPNANAVGSWGAAAEAGTPGSGGANYAPQGSPGANPFSYTAAAAAAASNVGAGASGYVGDQLQSRPGGPQVRSQGVPDGYGNYGAGASPSGASPSGASPSGTPGLVMPVDYMDSDPIMVETYAAEGGPISSIKHTSKKSKSKSKPTVSAASGGAIPDPTDSGTMSGDMSGVMRGVQGALSASRSQFGLSNKAFSDMSNNISGGPQGGNIAGKGPTSGGAAYSNPGPSSQGGPGSVPGSNPGTVTGAPTQAIPSTVGANPGSNTSAASGGGGGGGGAAPVPSGSNLGTPSAAAQTAQPLAGMDSGGVQGMQMYAGGGSVDDGYSPPPLEEPMLEEPALEEPGKTVNTNHNNPQPNPDPIPTAPSGDNSQATVGGVRDRNRGGNEQPRPGRRR